MLRIKLPILSLALFISPEIAFGAAQISVSGFASKSHQKLQNTDSNAVSASIAFDIFSMVQLGYTLRTSSNIEHGTIENEDGAPPLDYIDFRYAKNVVKQSVDLTLVPFMTRTIVPFIFGGVAQQTYLFRKEEEVFGGTSQQSLTIRPGEPGTGNPLFAWNGGLGVRIPLNSDFSIKVTQTYTESKTQSPGGKVQDTLDTYTEFGISYNL
jgi:hypothetical protein